MTLGTQLNIYSVAHDNYGLINDDVNIISAGSLLQDAFLFEGHLMDSH